MRQQDSLQVLTRGSRAHGQVNAQISATDLAPSSSSPQIIFDIEQLQLALDIGQSRGASNRLFHNSSINAVMVEDSSIHTRGMSRRRIGASAVQRWSALIGGSVLAVYGLSRRWLTGIALAAGGGTIAPLGSGRTATASRTAAGTTLLVNCSPEEAYKFWRHFENLAVIDRVKEMVAIETDRPVALRQAIQACHKGGTVSVLGVYAGFDDKIPMGAFMNKASHEDRQTHMMRFMKPLLEKVENGEIDPSFVISHRVPIDRAPEMYRVSATSQDNCSKVVLDPWADGAAAA